MPRHATKTSFKIGIDRRTGLPTMTEAERKVRKKEYYQKHKHKTLQKNWVRQIKACGWTPEEYDAAMKEQGGVCFICKKEDFKKLAADHCHKTGRRRSLLCTRCNTALGLVKENIEILRRMEDYCAQL